MIFDSYDLLLKLLKWNIFVFKLQLGPLIPRSVCLSSKNYKTFQNITKHYKTIDNNKIMIFCPPLHVWRPPRKLWQYANMNYLQQKKKAKWTIVLVDIKHSHFYNWKRYFFLKFPFFGSKIKIFQYLVRTKITMQWCFKEV